MTSRSDASDPARLALPMAWACLAAMAAMRVCDAMLPALGSRFGVAATDASATVSAFAVGYGVMQLVYGWIGDRLRLPRVIGMAALVAGVASIACAAAPSLPLLVAGRALTGAAAGGIMPLTMAWIGETVAWSQRQLVLARLLTWIVAGLIAGAWGGGVLADTIGWRWTFAGLAVVFVVPGALLWRRSAGLPRRARSAPAASASASAAPVAADPGSAPSASAGPAASPPPYLQRVRTLLADRWARQLYAITMAEGALIFGVLAFTPTLLHERLGVSLSAAGGIVALFGVGGFVYSRAARWLLARLSQPRLGLGGGLALCIGFAAIGTAGATGVAAAACLAAGLGYYMLHNTLQTRATQLTTTARGLAMTLFSCSLFVGQSAGVLLAAAFVERGAGTSYFVGAGVGLLLLGAVFARQARRHPAGA